ncbi:MAG TPA: serine/threonine-protein kinase [Nannocystaceae bacterium]|nr:serine/threonine-protein kinase [Nannocystaceae bacterium]
MSAPEKLGPYRILARVGAGGMAEVFAAMRFGASGFSKRVAIKVLAEEHADDAELQKLLIAEAKLGAAMSHPNLVGVSDLGVDAGRYYVVMDLIEGADVGRLLAARRPGEALALYVVDRVAAALGYLHAFRDESGRSLGLVHRDVSPANVLVSNTGEVKLADYGIAKATHAASQTQGRVVRGKYAYLSPEQIAGDPVSAKSDQFALGVMMIELVTGRRPFDGASAVETMDRIREGVASRLDALPGDLLELATRCLAVDPRLRWPDMAAVRERLQEARRARAAVGSAELARWVLASA